MDKIKEEIDKLFKEIQTTEKELTKVETQYEYKLTELKNLGINDITEAKKKINSGLKDLEEKKELSNCRPNLRGKR